MAKKTISVIYTVEVGNTVKVKSAKDIKDDSRLFYRVGYYIGEGKNTTWILTNTWKEIKDVKKFLKEDEHLHDKKYIDHHQFRIQKEA